METTWLYFALLCLSFFFLCYTRGKSINPVTISEFQFKLVNEFLNLLSIEVTVFVYVM